MVIVMRKFKNVLWGILWIVFLVVTILEFSAKIMKSDAPNNVKAIIVLLVVIIMILGTILKKIGFSGEVRKTANLYRKDFGKYIDGAFNGKLLLKKRLESAIYNFHCNKYESALKMLDRLYKKCDSAEDYCGVLIIKALCYQYTNNMVKNIEVYEEMLEYNGTLADIWLYLAIAYLKNNDYENYARCNQNCLTYDPQNAEAFSNMGSYYLRTGNPQKAVEYATRALRIKSSLYQAMSILSAAYCMMGDMGSCERYKSMYIANGGNAENINEYISRLSMGRF